MTLHDHSLDSYEGHGMVHQQELAPWNVSKQHHFLPKFDGRVLNFLSTVAQNVVWTDRDGDTGGGLTLHDHSLYSYGGHGMVPQLDLALLILFRTTSVLPQIC